MPGTRSRTVQHGALVCALLLTGVSAGTAQAPGPTPQPTPAASYASLLQSFDEVRNDMGNWSAIEQAAYAHAAPECLRLQGTAYGGNDLLALARLCALGQDWVSTYSAVQ